VQGWVTSLDIEKDADGVHQDDAQQPVEQMPRIAGPDLADTETADQLTEDRLDPVAFAAEPAAKAGGRIARCQAEGANQDDRLLAQLCEESRAPEAPIAKHKAGVVGNEIGQDGVFTDVGRYDRQTVEETRCQKVDVEPKAVEGGPAHVVTSIGAMFGKAAVAVGTGKTTDGEGTAVHPSQLGIVGRHAQHGLPEQRFPGPEVGRLPDKGRAMNLPQARKEVSPVIAEVAPQGTVLGKTEETPDRFDREHLAIGECRLRTALAQALTVGHDGE